MNYLIIDPQGMVGDVVFRVLQERGNAVDGWDTDWTKVVHSGDFSALTALKNTLSAGKYDAVVNCSAVINQEAERDKAAAAFINTFLPHFLEQATADTQTIVVHRSTDCIFSGRKGGYTLADRLDGESYYAQTKALGELVNDKDITIRTSLVGPERDAAGGSLLNWFMMQSGAVNGFSGAIWTGLTTVEFAREIDQLVQLRAHGLFQCVPKGSISKLELLRLFAEVMPGEHPVNAVETALVDKSLTQELGGYPIVVPDYREMMSEMGTWIAAHKELYPHYFRA